MDFLTVARPYVVPIGSDCAHIFGLAVNPLVGGTPRRFRGHLDAQVWCGFKYVWTDSAEMTVSTGAIIGHLNILVGLDRGDLLSPASAFPNRSFSKLLKNDSAAV